MTDVLDFWLEFTCISSLEACLLLCLVAPVVPPPPRYDVRLFTWWFMLGLLWELGWCFLLAAPTELDRAETLRLRPSASFAKSPTGWVVCLFVAY